MMMSAKRMKKVAEPCKILMSIFTKKPVALKILRKKKIFNHMNMQHTDWNRYNSVVKVKSSEKLLLSTCSTSGSSYSAGALIASAMEIGM